MRMTLAGSQPAGLHQFISSKEGCQRLFYKNFISTVG